jgi:DNA oxidative demethylase
MYQQDFFAHLYAPKSIVLVEDFINQAEENRFLQHFRTLQWQKIKMQGVIAKRQVVHFGLDYTYSKRSVRSTRPAPKWLNPLTEKAAKLIDKSIADIKEILVTHYPAGAGIGWHKDAEVFGDAVVGVSFLSECIMKFKNPESSAVYKLLIPPRSAYVFSGDARWKWQHSISTHSQDRYSITFRTLSNSR